MSDSSWSQASAQFSSIAEMITEVEQGRKCEDKECECEANGDECVSFEDAEQTVHEDALEVSVRTDWHAPSSENGKANEFLILLCTGGPACRIVGDLSEHGEPDSARIEHQDWGEVWQTWPMTDDQEETVLDYCRCFYFGE